MMSILMALESSRGGSFHILQRWDRFGLRVRGRDKYLSAFFGALLVVLAATPLWSQSAQPARLGPQWGAVPRLKMRVEIAYDAHRDVVVQFGGGVGGLGSTRDTFLNRQETWEWDGKGWKAREPLHRPTARSHHAMAYDPVSKRVILFGGTDGKRIFGDTWAWDGQDWTLLKPKNSPTARIAAAVATDPIRGRLVLFGGGLGFNDWVTGLRPQADTWEWTGTDWSRRTPKTIPDARAKGKMMYCPLSKRIVLISGEDSLFGHPPFKTWEWDGKNWYRHDRYPAPLRFGYGATLWRSGRVLYVMTEWDRVKKEVRWYSSLWDGKDWKSGTWTWPKKMAGPLCVSMDRSKTVLMIAMPFGFPTGRNDSDVHTFSYDEVSWKALDVYKTPMRPDGLVHDEARDETLVFSLPDKLSAKQSLEISRIDSNGNFKPIQVSKKPPYRSGFLVLYHSGLKKVWIYGGVSKSGNPSTYAHDCWTWDGRKWEEIQVKNAPAVYWRACTYDPIRDKVIVSMSQGQFLEWDLKTGWSTMQSKTRPPSRYASAMVYDASRRRIVLFGGYSSKGDLNDTWEFDGKDWKEVKTKTLPPKRANAQLQYVSALGGILMFGGGLRVAPQRDTWFYDGKDWTKISDNTYKAWNRGSGPFLFSTYDVGRQRVLALKQTHPSVEMLWKFQVRTLSITQPYPRSGEAISLNVLLPTQAQRPVLFLLAGSDRPGISLRHVPGLGIELLPLAPDALFMTSLSLGLVNVLDAKGRATMPFKIPKLPSLIGVSFHAAALTLDLRGGIGAITNGVPLRIVR